MLVASGLIVKIISVKKHWNYAILCRSLQKLQLFPSTGSNVWVFNVVPCRNCNCSLLQDQMIGFFYVLPCRNCNCSLLQDQMIGFLCRSLQKLQLFPSTGSNDWFFLGGYAKLRKKNVISFVMSVRLSPCNNSAPTGGFS